MEKEPYIPLTIDRAKTKARILAKERDLRGYAKRRKIAQSTLVRILLDGKHSYPHQDARQSAFQRALRKMVTDGYLVQLSDEQPLDEAA